jgi:hypothetical protein
LLERLGIVSGIRWGLEFARKAIDGPIADVESHASAASVDGKSVAFADATGRPIPDFQRDAMPIGRAAVAEEDFAASRIGPWENQSGICHFDQSFRPGAPNGRAPERGSS